MSKLALITSLKNATYVAKAAVKSHAPEILLATGCVSFVATVVTASKATIKAQDILENHHEALNDIKICAAQTNEEEYSESDQKKDVIVTYSKTCMSMAKIYLPAVLLGTLAVACFLTSYGILKKRNLALIASYNALNEAFNLYRKRVVEDKGVEADQYYLSGIKPETIAVTDENGNKEKKKVIKGDPNLATPYSFKFGKYKANGERNWQWENDANLNRMYLYGQQDFLNDKLYSLCKFNSKHEVVVPGVVMLNEVREICGEDITEPGAVVGWRFSNGEPGCNGYVDFNLIEGTEPDPENPERMINCFYLNPNCDGLVFDLIGKKVEVPFTPNFLIE